MTQTRKGFFFDIDDTLTSELDGTIPESVRKAFEIIRSHGDLTFINTGRSFVSVTKEIRALGPDGFICGCGTSLCDAQGALLWRAPMEDCLADVEQAAATYGVDVLLEGRNHLSFIQEASPITAGCQHLMDRYYSILPDHVVSCHDQDFEYDKFVCWHQDKNQLAGFAQAISSWYDRIDRSPHCGCSFFEMVPNGCSKGNGLRQVCQLKDIPLENTYAFGDSTNDLEMLKAASHAVVMGNSTFEEVRRIATVIADKASEDGIYKMICKIYEQE